MPDEQFHEEHDRLVAAAEVMAKTVESVVSRPWIRTLALHKLEECVLWSMKSVGQGARERDEKSGAKHDSDGA